jgi:putative tricarboxylic transport membrane protein
LYGIIMFCLGLAILWQGKGLTIGTLRNPGSGLFPALIAVTILILSVILILFPPVKKGSPQQDGAKQQGTASFSMKPILRTAAVFAALLLYAFLLEYLGFVIVSFILTTLLFLAFGTKNLLRSILQAALFTGLAYGLFEVLLKSSLPRGLLGF